MAARITHITDAALTHPVVNRLASLTYDPRGEGDTDYYYFTLADRAKKRLSSDSSFG